MATTVFSDIDWDGSGKQVGTLFLPHSPDDDAWGVIPFPAASIRNGEGPVVVVSGAVHGDEYEGPVVIAELMREIRVEDVQGQLILLPSFNAPAQRAGRFVERRERASPREGAARCLAHVLSSLLADASVAT